MSERVCLITGASRGIGAATARELGARGYGVVVNHRDSATAAEAVAHDVRAAGGAAEVVQGDVTDADDVTRLVDAALGRWGRLDALAAATPTRRLARPEDVARTVAHFVGDDAGFTTGSWAPVNGGLIMP